MQVSELTEHKLTTDPMENLKCLIAWRDKGIILSTRRTVVNSHGDYGENLIATQTTSPTHAAGQNYFFLHFLSLRLHPLFFFCVVFFIPHHQQPFTSPLSNRSLHITQTSRSKDCGGEAHKPKHVFNTDKSKTKHLSFPENLSDTKQS